MQSYLGTVHMLCRQQTALGGHRDTHPDCMTEQEEKGLLAAQQTKMGVVRGLGASALNPHEAEMLPEQYKQMNA